MISNDNIIQYAQSTHNGENFDFRIIDCSVFDSTSLDIRQRCRNFRDQLVGKYQNNTQTQQGNKYKWTIEIIWSDVIESVINFNESHKSVWNEHRIMFICVDDKIKRHEQHRLTTHHVNSVFLMIDNNDPNKTYQRAFEYLDQNQDNQIVEKRPKRIDYSYPLRLHTNSISTGLVFNYYYSYLNRHVASTNNIFFKFTFNKTISENIFPSSIFIKFESRIENIYLERYPSTTSEDTFRQIQSNIIKFNKQPFKYCSQENQTLITYFVDGVKDFGTDIKKISIWQEKFDIESLISIELLDDVRHWNVTFKPSQIRSNSTDELLVIFKSQTSQFNGCTDCYLFNIKNLPTISNESNGISTMKKTTKDCYDKYKNFLTNKNDQDDYSNIEIRMVPVYYILAPSSCYCGSADNSSSSECGPIHLQGIIVDPDDYDRIHLAYINKEVLTSEAMKHYERYLLRTYYYFDEKKGNKIIRYVFAAEYPFILSVLYQLERNQLIDSVQRTDEYLRFCSMLNRIIEIENLSESVKLIQYDDKKIEERNYSEGIHSCEDSKSLLIQIKEDMDQWYEKSIDFISETSILTQIVQSAESYRLVIFYSEELKKDKSIMDLIENLQKNLEKNNDKKN